MGILIELYDKGKVLLGKKIYQWKEVIWVKILVNMNQNSKVRKAAVKYNKMSSSYNKEKSTTTVTCDNIIGDWSVF